MAVTQKVTLYNNKFTVPPVINAVQNDTDRQVVATFGDFTLTSGMTAKLSFIRSDGTHYEATGTINTTNNTVTAELDQALTQVGICKAQIKVTETDGLGSTFTFIIKVQPDVAGISVPQDGWSAQEFDQRLTDAENAIDAVEEDVADLQDKEYDYAPVITDTASGSIASFPDGADGYPLKSCVVDVDAVQSGSGDPSPTNVRPITGWSEAKVTRCGKNLFDKSTVALGYYLTNTNTQQSSPNGSYSDYIPIKTGVPYYFSHVVGLGSFYTMCVYDASKTFIENINISGTADSSNTVTFTRGSYIRVNVAQPYLDTCQIEFGSSATAYEEYDPNGTTFTISLGDTRYGAVLDVTRGKLRVTWAIDNLGNMTWSYNTPYKMFYRSLTNASFNENHILTSQYGLFTSFADLIADVTKDGAYKSLDNNHSLYIRDTRYSDPAVFKSAMDGVQIAYELGTPVEVDLTPTEITTLLGTNNLWSDTGDVEVEYCAQTKLYIDKKIAEIINGN